MQAAVQNHPAFRLLRKHSIASLNLDMEEYEHKQTGAIHYHLAADNPENVFMVALRTVPEDSSGVAHILEHTALCGSERYPVRDPFFMMIRRSLNTFMNAFTSSDWTAYPFASQNRKDFQNLLEVYLDAVFFSRLDPLDFAQEGHRLEFAEADNPNSELQFKGVVFNEMKGAMSSVPSQLWQAVCKHLFPTTTYHHNSGGEPENIPDLTYNELVDFYRSHYHPSNAIFMTFGDIPASEHQTQFESLALERFEALQEKISVGDEQRYTQPIAATEAYPFNEADSSNKHHVVVGWLLGSTTDLESVLEAQLLTNVLLDNSASPLLQALETTTLGNSPSPLCGIEDSMKEMVFVCGLEGCEEQSLAAVEQLILDTITAVASDGVAFEQLEAMLNQLELTQREISGDSYPYGLQLLLTALGSATHRGDPIAVLDMEPAIAAVRKKIVAPEYIKQLARRLLLDNPHRLTLHMKPDEKLSEQKLTAEKARLQAIQAELSDAQKQAIIDQALALKERQQSVEDEAILPKVGLEDISKGLPDIPSSSSKSAALATTSYSRGTNGLVYQQIVMKMPQLPTELAKLVPYYTSMLTEVGLGADDYLQTQARQASVCGSINAFNSFRGGADNEQDATGFAFISSKALTRFHREQSQLIRDTLAQARFDEHGRLRELLAQQRASAENSITGNGHVLAMQAASSGMSPVARLSHELSGLAGISTLKARHDASKEDKGIRDYANSLTELHRHFQDSDKQLLVIAEEDALKNIAGANATIWSDTSTSDQNHFALPSQRESVRECWLTATEVNFCAKAYASVPMAHPDAAALTVLGGFLRNGFLHRTIREQGGAYGGGASQDSNIAAFRFYSYRDPRSVDTLDDFDQSLEWLQSAAHNDEQLEQAILGVIGSLDKPGSPAGEAKRDFQSRLYGRSKALRDQFRERLLKVSIIDLKRVAQQYLQPEQASIAVITSQSAFDQNKAAYEKLSLNLRRV
ncbi:MAG: Zn-dependent M16 (insulinase) family peptidase [Bermanella sp.]|jgi:Zn-dependent M16 (insulinase) family peptidase